MKAASRLCSAPLLIASAIRVGLLLICWVLILSPARLCSQTNPVDQDNKLEPVRTSITVVEKISTEVPANVLVRSSMKSFMLAGVAPARPLARAVFLWIALGAEEADPGIDDAAERKGGC